MCYFYDSSFNLIYSSDCLLMTEYDVAMFLAHLYEMDIYYFSDDSEYIEVRYYIDFDEELERSIKFHEELRLSRKADTENEEYIQLSFFDSI